MNRYKPSFAIQVQHIEITVFLRHKREIAPSIKMSNVEVRNMSFKVGQTLTITGVPNPEAARFAINIGHSAEDIALHLNPRFNADGDERQVVCNSFQAENWCEEIRDGGFPFNEGEEFKITITFTKEEFLVTLTDGSEIHFPNRQGDEKYKFIFFEGEARIQGIEIK